MSNIIDQNEVFRKFNFSSTITAEDNQNAIAIIKHIIDSGKQHAPNKHSYYLNLLRF